MRLVVVVLLLGGSAWLAVRAWSARGSSGSRLPVAVAVLVVPGLLLGWFEYEDHAADGRLSQTASVLAGRPVHVSCQRLLGTMIDASANRGEVYFDADGRPADETVLKYDTCQALYDYLGSAKVAPDLDQVVAVHVLAHEAAHLAGERSEAVAECLSVQSTEATALLLGAPPDAARALAVRYAAEVYPRMPDDYRTTDCRDGGPLDLHPESGRWP